MLRTLSRWLPALTLGLALAPAPAAAQASPGPLALPPGTAIYGDVNGDGRVTALDAVAVLAYAVGRPAPGGYQMLPNGDASGDGQVTAMDALVIAASAAGRDMSRFPVGQEVAGTLLDPDGPSRATAPAGSTLTLLAGDGQKGFAGDSLKGALQVVLKNASGNPVPSVTVTWTVLTGGGALRAGTSKTGATGIATNKWLMGPAGSQTVRASIAGIGQVDFTATSIDPTTSTIAIRSGDEQTGTAGDTLPRVVTVLVKDASNSVIPGVSIAWTVLTGGGSVPAARTATSATGVASSRWVLGATPGTQTLKAAIPGGPSVTFTADARAGGSITVTKLSDNLYGIAGDSLGMGGWVQVQDALNNPVSTTITWTPQEGGAVSLTRSATNSDGRANSRWRLGPGTGVQHLVAKADGVADSVVFSTTAVSPDSVVLSTGGDSQQADGGTLLNVYLDVQDPAGNPISGFVAYAPLTGGSPTPAGRVVTFTDVAGATNPGRAPMTWTLGSARGYQTFQASVAGGTRTATFTALSLLLASDSLTQAAGSSSGTAGEDVATPPSVRVADANGTVVADYPVVFRVTAGGGSINGAATADSVVVSSDASGIASLTSWTLGSSGTNTVHVSAGARSLDVDATASAGVPSGATSEVTTAVGTLSSGSITTVTVTLKDAAGNLVTTGGATVEIASTLGSVGTVTDVGDGTYTADLTNTGAAGTATVTAKVNGGAITDDATVTFTTDGTLRAWTGTGGTNWSTTTSWSPTGTPAASDTVSIGSATNQPLITDGAKTVARLVMSGASTLGLGGYTLTVTGDADASGGTVSGGTLVMSGAGASLKGTFAAIQVTGGISAGASVKATGAVSVTGSLHVADQAFSISIP
jgi:adhesin/invasin